MANLILIIQLIILPLPLVFGWSPLRKGKIYIEHFSMTGECSTFFNIMDAYSQR